MREAQGTTRMNISVPTTLKQEMDAVSANVNWSAIAAAAFRVKLLQLNATKETVTMEAVIRRMRAEAELDANGDYQEGSAVGEEWARQWAKPKGLKRLNRAVAGSVEQYVRANDGHIGRSLGEVICGSNADPDEVHDLWMSASDSAEEIEDVDFARGFIDGALRIWRAVENKL